MQLVFIESSNGIRLTKHVSATETKSYPNVKAVNSHHYDVPPSAEGQELLPPCYASTQRTVILL